MCSYPQFELGCLHPVSRKIIPIEELPVANVKTLSDQFNAIPCEGACSRVPLLSVGSTLPDAGASTRINSRGVDGTRS